MATPQTEDGYTKIANELLDAVLAGGFGKRELTLIFAVVRKTYGYNKKTDDMTLTQLANLTGIKLSHVSETVRDLAARNVFLFREGVFGYVIGIQKDYTKWKGSQNGKHVPKTGRFPKREGEVPKTGTSASQNGNHKRQPQKTTPKDKGTPSQNGNLPEWLDEQTWNDFLAHRRAIKKPMTDAAVTKMWNKLGEMRKAGHDPNEVLNESIINGWQGVFWPKKGEAKKQGQAWGDHTMVDFDEVGNA